MQKSRFPSLRIDPVTVAVLLGLLITENPKLVAVLTLATALHECGHLIVAKLMKIQVSEFRLGLLGARIEVRGMLSYGREWALAAAGPAVSFLGAAVTVPFVADSNFWSQFCAVSLLLGTLNLLPIQTFDGGRMLYCLLAKSRNADFAQTVLRGISFCVLFLLWAFSVYLLLRAGSGISWLGFSFSLLLGFFEQSPLTVPILLQGKQRKTEKSREKREKL